MERKKMLEKITLVYLETGRVSYRAGAKVDVKTASLTAILISGAKLESKG